MAARLNISTAQAVGHLTCLWLWALDNLPSGATDTEDIPVLASAGQWMGNADQFVSALIDAGFLHQEQSELAIHDWQDYAGRLLDQRKFLAERKKRKRELYDDGALTRAVRARDGDACRYCGKTVRWEDRKGPDGGTYDHIDPDGPNNPDNLVVACRSCNGRKGRRTPERAGLSLLTARYLPGIYRESDNPSKCDLLDSTQPYRTQPNSTGGTGQQIAAIDEKLCLPDEPVVTRPRSQGKRTTATTTKPLTDVQRKQVIDQFMGPAGELTFTSTLEIEDAINASLAYNDDKAGTRDYKHDHARFVTNWLWKDVRRHRENTQTRGHPVSRNGTGHEPQLEEHVVPETFRSRLEMGRDP